MPRKHGVHGLTRVAAMENAARGIRVNALAPGWTETPMVVANSTQNPAFAELARTTIPAKRGGQPRELAEAALVELERIELSLRPYAGGRWRHDDRRF
jgi:NAD(P)-dependent dehydrogenase (short-subunit alcohol dehydrogenase family)